MTETRPKRTWVLWGVLLLIAAASALWGSLHPASSSDLSADRMQATIEGTCFANAVYGHRLVAHRGPPGRGDVEVLLEPEDGGG